MSVLPRALAILLLLVSALPGPASAQTLLPASNPAVLDFEQFQDGDALTTQLPGLTFSNAVIATAGQSLNELEAPPHSGVNVAEDNGGPISIGFASLTGGFGGYFNYSASLTMSAFDAQGNLVSLDTSGFSNNLVTSGDPGSSANEFLQVGFPNGISSVTIKGDPAGGSFTLDDATITPFSAPPFVPEPSPGLLLAAGLVLLAMGRRRTSP